MTPSEVEAAAKDVGELAFEHGLEESNPPIVYRVVNEKVSFGKVMRRSEWFADEKQAWKRAAWRIEDGQEVLSVAKYVLERQG